MQGHPLPETVIMRARNQLDNRLVALTTQQNQGLRLKDDGLARLNVKNMKIKHAEVK